MKASKDDEIQKHLDAHNEDSSLGEFQDDQHFTSYKMLYDMLASPPHAPLSENFADKVVENIAQEKPSILAELNVILIPFLGIIIALLTFLLFPQIRLDLPDFSQFSGVFKLSIFILPIYLLIQWFEQKYLLSKFFNKLK